ncbi:hypothetical protein P7D73_18160 [Enterococcus raffinosus]|uniref:hypothetical protein n=1 Tax=Enterococcus raffinosus TaxID=71452 RepID=UPI00288EC462|nr:hypothetical protein [Enterococcus raffinosus]MDT2525131.1 hypothetical protein [Enterococcus raffinosus]MDT2592486.1 hypothetical protein [Enterococcus raffinosus]
MAKLSFRQKRFIKHNDVFLKVTSNEIDFTDTYLYDVAKSVSPDLPKTWNLGTVDQTLSLLQLLANEDTYKNKSVHVELMVNADTSLIPKEVYNLSLSDNNLEGLKKSIDQLLNEDNQDPNESVTKELNDIPDSPVINEALYDNSQMGKKDSTEAVESATQKEIISFGVPSNSASTIPPKTKPSFKEKRKVRNEKKIEPKQVVNKGSVQVSAGSNNQKENALNTEYKPKGLTPIAFYLNQLAINIPYYSVDQQLIGKTYKDYEDLFVPSETEKNKKLYNVDLENLNEDLSTKGSNLLKSQYNGFDRQLNYLINEWVDKKQNSLSFEKFEKIKNETRIEKNKIKDEVISTIEKDKAREIEEAERQFNVEKNRIISKYDKIVDQQSGKIDSDYKKIEIQKISQERSKLQSKLDKEKNSFIESTVREIDQKLMTDVEEINSQNLDIISAYKKQCDAKLIEFKADKEREHINGLALYKQLQEVEQAKNAKEAEAEQKQLDLEHQKQLHELEIEKRKKELDKMSEDNSNSEMLEFMKQVILQRESQQQPYRVPENVQTETQLTQEAVEKMIQEKALQLYKEDREKDQFNKQTKVMKISLIGFGIVTVCALALAIFAFTKSTHVASSVNSNYDQPRIEQQYKTDNSLSNEVNNSKQQNK